MGSLDRSRRLFLQNATAALTFPAAGLPGKQNQEGKNTRSDWVSRLTRLASPVFNALSQRKLKATMPVEAPHGNQSERAQYTHLEALGRLLTGIAPWLETGASDTQENELRSQYAELARQSIAAAVDPASPDFMNFNRGSQPLVDAAFLALALLRSPNQLWRRLVTPVKSNVLNALRSSRVIRPSFSNWLLFSATIEAFFAFAGEWWDPMRVDYALRQTNEWYKGDGVYADGPEYHWDYYNSFVIHPMLLAISEAVAPHSDAWRSLEPLFQERAVRYAAIQCRLIAPDGSYPLVGRSLTYRCGAFHLLADIALRRQLPAPATPGSTRAALSAVIRRTLDATDTFDQAGWLRVGVCGHQPSVGEPYISTGSLYLASAAFLPLGLPASDLFWTTAAESWIGKQAWSGRDIPSDHAI
jgi:hypothetical protein